MTAPDDPAGTPWPRLKDALESGGPQALVTLIAGHADPAERRALFALAAHSMASRDWRGKNLDALISVAQAGIWESLQQADAASGEQCAALLDSANVLSYDLAAALAPCWPDDDLPHERRHFEAGLGAAEDCLRWREQLKKGPRPFAIAHWARGIHLNALGRHDEALAEHRRALARAEEAARAEGAATTVSPGAPWLVLLSAGYVALAERLAGGASQAGLERVLAILAEAARARPADADDLIFCADQLRAADSRLAAG